MSDLDSVCVVTHPLGGAGENATRSLLDILTAITPVALVAAGVAADSPLRTRDDLKEVVDVSVGQPADSIPIAAVQFLLHQLRLSLTIIRRDEPVVLFYGATSYLLPIVVAKLLGRTVILEPRGDVPLTLRLHWEERIPAPLARSLATVVWTLERVGYRLSDRIITYTPSMAAELGLKRDAYESKLHTDGARYVDTNIFSPSTPFEERDHVVGFLGRLDEEKGIKTLVEVARLLPDDITVRFVGDGNLREWLETELADEIAEGHVESVGWVDHEDVPVELNRLRLLVMPSEPTEGLPTTILEAMACGTPALATPVAGVPDVVHEGETGYLMPDSDPAAIAETIDEILQREDLPTVSRNGRELIDETYSFDAAVNRYEQILSALAER